VTRASGKSLSVTRSRTNASPRWATAGPSPR
jgi:hypothetical protein